jgi:hypothetical protein
MKRIMRWCWFLSFTTLALLVAPAPVLACSCSGIADIGTALSRAELVVVGRVERRLEPDYSIESMPSPSGDGVGWSMRFDPAPVAVKVVRALKGEATGEIRVTTDIMCYRSFNLEDFKPGDTFVFPIVEKTDSGLHVLPSCSHSAAKVVDGMLYTSEFVRGGGRQITPYLSLTAVRFLLPQGLLHKLGQYLAAGFIVLLVPTLITHRIRRRTMREAIGSARKINVRSVMAIMWMLLCGMLCIGLALLQIWPLPIGITLAFACAIAAAGLAFKWRWSEGFSYGMSLLWISGAVAGTWWVLSEYFEVFDGFPKEMVIFVAVVALIITGMLWYADTVRRRFSPSRGSA